MAQRKNSREKVEFGDFQTPAALAADVCAMLVKRGMAPRSVVEPTCGVGNLYFAALDTFSTVERSLGVDINRAYVASVKQRLAARCASSEHDVVAGNFFEVDWRAQLAALPEPLLVIGNPPWVTSADLGSLGSENAPVKSNFQARAGLDALTGKSNFDISEWMLLRLLSWLDGRRATLTMLCKTSVARKTLAFAWNAGYRVERAAMHRVDVLHHFGAAVDACLLTCDLGEACAPRCSLFDDLGSRRASAVLGWEDGRLIADATRHRRWRHLEGESPIKWRSGIKHDCASVMELRTVDGRYLDADGETVQLEPDLLFPMLKSSELARGDTDHPSRWMIVPQRAVGDDTAHIEHSAPQTWRYLGRHRDRFTRRSSSIYRGKPPFAIFGVGPYTFAPWKVAIAGLYKKLDFRVVGPHAGKPVVFDDTCYFASCRSEREAVFLQALLVSDAAQEFYAAHVFWDAKRPITVDILRRLDVQKLAVELGRGNEFRKLCAGDASSRAATGRHQLSLGLD